MFCFIGVDGGASRTRLVLIDADANVLAEADEQACNPNSVGHERCKETLKRGLCKILQSLPGNAQISAISLSVSGIRSEMDKRDLGNWTRSQFPSVEIIVSNDVEAALSCGTEGILEGVVCISGTGMNVFGCKNGERYHCGGLGPLLGDDGCGYSIGDEILKSIVKANDGRGPHTILGAEVFKQLSINEVSELIEWRYDPKRTWKDIAQFAPLVFQCSKNDSVSREIISQSSQSLVTAISAVASNFHQPFPIVLVGSLWKNEELLNLVKKSLSSLFPQASIVLPRRTPEYGAALLALKYNL